MIPTALLIRTRLDECRSRKAVRYETGTWISNRFIGDPCSKLLETLRRCVCVWRVRGCIVASVGLAEKETCSSMRRIERMSFGSYKKICLAGTPGCRSILPRNERNKIRRISCACDNYAVVVVCVFALHYHVFCSVMHVLVVLMMMPPFPVQYVCWGFNVRTQKTEDASCSSVTAHPLGLHPCYWNTHTHWENCIR